ncbi:hypothetical protein BC833DRAFT_537188 [Globomyces pollinis-pini]|nr:hypothetical protein BC833DRAFT_537188 [Globomyces pollinis-pini]
MIQIKSDDSLQVMPNFEKKLLNPRGSALKDGLAFMAYAAQAIAQDEFSKCFVQKPRNNLMKTLLQVGPISFMGMCYRYGVLFPIRYKNVVDLYFDRLAILLGATSAFFTLLPVVLYLKNEKWRRLLFRFYCKAFLRSWGSRIKRHGSKPIVKEPHIFVANHTSFIDYLILSADAYPHATVAQRHGGLIGYFQKHILSSNGSLIFERSQKNDRTVLARKMKEHVHSPTSVPLLIFPEGTCVNNEYTVLFHKGAFDLGCKVAPVAIKYNKNLADAYWHTKTQTFTIHLLYLMTRWGLEAEVWYLPPRAKRPNQSAIDFANEVKAEISQVANLKNLSWDGYWKNYTPPVEKQEKLKDNPRQRYSHVLMQRIQNNSMKTSRSRRFSFTDSNDYSTSKLELEQPEWVNPHADTMDLRNQVLVSLQEQERCRNICSLINDKRHDIVDTWKDSVHNRQENLYSRRIENLSWRLWFRERLTAQEALRKPESDMSSMIDMMASLLPLPLRIYSPDDLYSDLASIDILSPSSLSPRRINWDFSETTVA